jgi:hypothetical protein
MITLGTDVYDRFQIKIWLQKFRNGNLSSKDSPCTRRQPLTIGWHLTAVRQKNPFTSARVLAQHFLTSRPVIKEILHCLNRM